MHWAFGCMFFCVFFTVCRCTEELDIYGFFKEIAEMEPQVGKEKAENSNDQEYDWVLDKYLESITASRLNTKGSCYLWRDEELVIEKITTNVINQARCESVMNFNHPNIEKIYLYIKTLQDGVLEYYLIKAHYEEEFTLKSDNDEKYNYLSQIAEGIKYLHDRNLILNKNEKLSCTLSTKYDRTINKKQLQFIEDAYIKLKAAKQTDAKKTGKEKKKGLIILDVQKNLEALKNPIEKKAIRTKTEKRTHVLAWYNHASANNTNAVRINNNNKSRMVTRLFISEQRNNAIRKAKARDCYYFGMYINDVIEESSIRYNNEHNPLKKKEYRQNYRKNTKEKAETSETSKLIYDCMNGGSNERPKIEEIIRRLETAKKELLIPVYGHNTSPKRIKLKP